MPERVPCLLFRDRHLLRERLLLVYQPEARASHGFRHLSPDHALLLLFHVFAQKLYLRSSQSPLQSPMQLRQVFLTSLLSSSSRHLTSSAFVFFSRSPSDQGGERVDLQSQRPASELRRALGPQQRLLQPSFKRFLRHLAKIRRAQELELRASGARLRQLRALQTSENEIFSSELLNRVNRINSTFIKVGA